MITREYSTEQYHKLCKGFVRVNGCVCQWLWGCGVRGCWVRLGVMVLVMIEGFGVSWCFSFGQMGLVVSSVVLKHLNFIRFIGWNVLLEATRRVHNSDKIETEL